MANLIYAYLPETRDPIPNNFYLWRQFLHLEWVQNGFALAGLGCTLWLVYLFWKPKKALPSQEISKTPGLSPRPLLSPEVSS